MRAPRPAIAHGIPRTVRNGFAARPQADAWKLEAEQFAREHAGKFFDEAPLTNGELPIPADVLPAAADAGGLFLGGGFLHFDHAIFAFGAGFHTRPPPVPPRV